MKRDTQEKSSLFQSRLLFYRESLFIFGCSLYIRALAKCVMEEKTKYYCLTTKLMLTTNAHLLFNGKIWPLNIVLILIPSSCVYVCCTVFYFRYRPKISQFGDKETISVVHHSFSGPWTINTWICMTTLMHMVNIKHATDIFQTKIWVWQTRHKELSGFSGVIRPKMLLSFFNGPLFDSWQFLSPV